MSGKQVNIVFRGVDEALYLDEAFLGKQLTA